MSWLSVLSMVSSASLRARLACLVLLGMLPLVGMLLTGAFLDRSGVLTSARQRATELARLGAEQQDDILQEARTLLTVLSRVGMAGDGRAGSCYALLHQLAVDHPRFSSIAHINAEGRVDCTSAAEHPDVDVSDRPYVQRLLRPGATGFDMSELTTGRINGNPVVYVGMALPPSPGSDRPPGLLVVGLNLDWFNGLAAKLTGSDGNLTVVFDIQDGSVLARAPDELHYQGRKFPNNIVAVAARKTLGQPGLIEGFGPDSVDRIYAYASLPGSDGRTVLAIGLARDQVLADANRRMTVVLGLMLAVLMIAIGAAVAAAWRLVVQPAEMILGTTQRLGRGDLDARVTLPPWHAPELRLLAGTLNEMAVGFATAQAQLAESEARFRRLAGTDGLTGRPNRRMFDEAYAREWRRAARDGKSLSVLLLDVDRFKLFNDRYGHLAGDDCLRAVATAIGNATSRPGDLAARYGGEEFVVLLPNTDLQGALEVAERVRLAVAGLNLQHTGNEACGSVVTVSIGVQTARPFNVGAAAGKPGSEPEHDRRECDLWPEALMAEADKALYAAKCGGRNCVMTVEHVPVMEMG